MLSLTVADDTRSNQNKANILALYDLMINQKRPAEAVARYLVSDYIQHNPLIPNGAQGLADFFGQIASSHPKLRVEAHRIVAIGDYVWAHVNFINLFNDDPQDRGIACVDIFRMNAEGKAVEHWDVLQEVPDPQRAANPNGMF